LLAFRSLDPFRALREPDRRRRDEKRLSRSEQKTDYKPKSLLDSKIPIQVRIHLPPARSQQRTLWLPGASHAGGTQSSNPLCSSAESVANLTSSIRAPKISCRHQFAAAVTAPRRQPASDRRYLQPATISHLAIVLRMIICGRGRWRSKSCGTSSRLSSRSLISRTGTPTASRRPLPRSSVRTGRGRSRPADSSTSCRRLP
jgi:hypothetical protein